MLWHYLSPVAIVTTDAFIYKQIRYQLAFLIVALAMVLLSFLVAKHDAVQIFSMGTLNAVVTAEPVDLNYAAGVTWVHFGIVLALVFGFATYVLCLPAIHSIVKWTEFIPRFGAWIVVFAAVNAFSEELIFRGVVVTLTQGQMYPWQTMLLSAILFAMAHLRGQANGWFVMAGSAIVGWFLAMAVLQTQGLFWAWCVHFVQNIVIFTAFIANVNGGKALHISPLNRS